MAFIDGFGGGVMFSGRPDDNYLQLHQQRQLQAQRLQAQQQQQQQEALKGQQARVDKEADNFKQSFAKVHPVYTPAMQQSYNNFVDGVMKLKEKAPYNYTQLPEYYQLENQLYKDANDYVAASGVVGKILENKGKYKYIPGYEGVETALQNNDHALLKDITKDERGLLTGRVFYEPKNLEQQFFRAAKDIQFVSGENDFSVSNAGLGMVKEKQVKRRNKAALEAEAAGLYDANPDVIQYQYPQFIGKKKEFIDYLVSQAPIEDYEINYQNQPKPDKVDIDGGDGSDLKVLAEDYWKRLSAVATGDMDAYEYVVPNPEVYSEDAKPYYRSYRLQGDPYKEVIDEETGKKVMERIEEVRMTPDKKYTIITDMGNEYPVRDGNFYQYAAKPYMIYEGKVRGQAYNNHINKLAIKDGVVKDGSKERWGEKKQDNVPQSKKKKEEPKGKYSITGKEFRAMSIAERKKFREKGGTVR